MRLLIALGLFAAAPVAAAAQAPHRPVLEALRLSFPKEHSALEARLAAQPPEAARRLVSEAMVRFQLTHKQAILAAPGARLIALEVRYGAMLRALGARDMRLCAILGDRGVFGKEARAAAPFAGLDEHAVALIEAAAAGAGRAAPAPANGADFRALMTEVERREPGVPVRQMLADRELRLRSSDEHLCVGAAAMHEAIAGLPPDQAARAAVTLIESAMVEE